MVEIRYTGDALWGVASGSTKRPTRKVFERSVRYGEEHLDVASALRRT